MSAITVPVLAPSPQVDSLWEQAVQRYQQDSNNIIHETLPPAPVTATTLRDKFEAMDAVFRQYRNNGSKLHKLRGSLSRCLPLIESLGEVAGHATKAV